MPLKVRVRNYQSIEDATIIIDGFTSLTGTNNAGKSALFRAIRGAFTNTRGSAFVRLGTTHATVEIEDLDQGHQLVWEKGPKINRYTINGKKIDRVGHGVPPEISALFGVQPLQVGGNTLWPQIAPQMNGVMFLLDQPGSVIAEAVADVERVNQLNSALKLSESDRKTAKADLKLRLKDGVKFQEAKIGFDGLDPILVNVRNLQVRRDQALKIATAHKNLVKIGERYKSAQSSVAALAGLETLTSKLPSEERVAKAQAFRHALGITVDLAVRYEAAKQELESAQGAHSVLHTVKLEGTLEDKSDRVKRVLDKAQDLRERLVKSKSLLSKIDTEIETRGKELATLNTRATSILGTFSDCPTCGGPLDHLHG